MNADIVNPVLEASTKILKILLFQDVTLGKPVMAKRHVLLDTLAILFWITGDFQGRFLFSMSRPAAVRIASAMMGEDAIRLDEFGKSALGEMASMILGRCGILFSERGVDIRIGYPTIIEGANVHCAPLGGEMEGRILRIPLLFENGDTMDVRFEQGTQYGRF